MAAPAEKLDTHTPIASVRWFESWNMLRMSDRVEGAMVAPEIPRSALLTMSISALVENAARTEVAPNAPPLIRSSLRRPILSPSVPIVTRNPATKNP
jgi:hypothetical protein